VRAGRPAHGKPCPKDLEAKDGARVEIHTCVWGKFAGEGWMVFYDLPLLAGSKPEDRPDAVLAFVASDGRIVASQQFGGADGKIDARAIDFDGDGVDELVATYRIFDRSTNLYADTLLVARVTGRSVGMEYATHISFGGVASSARARSPTCARVHAPWGRHVFDYANGELIETK
jgi:hypothetical protein